MGTEQEAEAGVSPCSLLIGAADEGVGILAVVALNNQRMLRTLSQLTSYAQALWLNPPATGARIITSILCNPFLREGW